MRNRNKAPLGVSVVAIFVTIFAMLLFGGVTHAADEAQSAAQSTTAQSVGATTVAVTDEAQSSSSSNAAAVANNDAQPANSGHGCISRDISPGEIETSLVTSDGSLEFTAYEAVRFSVTLTLEEGHCAGDHIDITVPSELGTDGNDSPIPMTTPSGIIIGYATYNGTAHKVTVTLTDEVEVSERQGFHADAWWLVHMSSVLVPGETRELVWNIDGVVRRTTIQVGVCDGCSTIGAEPSKWGSVDDSKQHVTLVLPTAEHDGQTFTVTDTLTSPGQSFTCDQLLTGRIGVYSEAGDWGQPMYTRYIEPDVVSCDNTRATINVKLDKGEKARFQLNVSVSATDPGPWRDVANITSQDKSWEVAARIIRRESGGNAGFDTNPVVPTPTPTPSPSPSAPSPTPSPSPTPTPVTPTPAPSASPSPSPTPSTSPEPTPSTTPEPSPSATPSTSPAPTPEPTSTPSPSTTPSATPVPTPTPSTTPAPVPTPTPTPSTPPRQFRLPITGGAGSSAIAVAVALLTAGVATFWMRRRQTTHPEG